MEWAMVQKASFYNSENKTIEKCLKMYATKKQIFLNRTFDQQLCIINPVIILLMRGRLQEVTSTVTTGSGRY